MLQLGRIQIIYNNPIIQDGSLTIPNGKLTALIGPSGSGKTALLYCVGLISSNEDYEYIFNGKQINLSSEQEKGELRKKKIGYVFQENNLNQNLTVGENIQLSASLAGADTDFLRITELLKQVGMEGRDTDYPKTLSCGEQQRVAIACVLAKNPELILADEPTASLDEENTEQVLKLFEEIAAQGKMVVIATHSPIVVERCDFVYSIQDKKLVLIKGREYIDDKFIEVDEKFTRKKNINLPFFFRYQFKSSRKGQILKKLTIGICALSIAFTSLSTGYIKDFGEQQQAYFKSVSERELVVSKGESYYTPIIPSLTEEQIQLLQQIDGIEASAPFVYFANRTDFTSDEVDYNQEGILNSYISYRNKSGKSGKQGFCNGEFTSIDGTITGTGEGIVDSYYCVVSYMSYESMDLKCTIVNQDVKPNTGIYVPEQKMRELGLTKEDILGLELTMDVAVPVKRIVDEDKGQYVTDWCVSKQLTFPVRGILQEDAYFYSDAIYAPSEILMQCVEDNRTEKDILDDYQKKFGQNLSDSMTYNWRPWAYYLMVDDVSNIDSVKKAVAEISPDLNVIHEYQDYEAIMESVDNTQRIVLYISLAILAILLCLSAIVYVNIIDKRKYEFAMLRANGLTKGEIRKLVMTEMAVQAFWTFAVSLLFAWVIFLVLSNTIGGFQFDWMTVMWLAVISVVSVILPSVVTLVLTNKYEPDAIMRN